MKGVCQAVFTIALAFLTRSSYASTCQSLLKSLSPGTNEKWVDADTLECTKTKCRLDYLDCLGATGFPPPYGMREGPPRQEDMVLVFSDEFNSKWRDFRPGKDARWQALDLLYVNGDAAMFRSSAVKVRGGTAIITASKTQSSGPFSALWGDQLATAKYTSGMLQGWNKFCFTGGYLEARVKLPGDDQNGGFWPAVFTLGNLGRAGYLRSTDGVWPWSYDTCDSNALYKQNWTDHNGQRINACNSTKGRGASEIDLLEVGVWESSKPELSTSLQVAPVLPQGLHWLDIQGGVYYPTYSDPTLRSAPNGWAGVNSYMQNATTFRPRPGSKLADALSATHRLNASHFSDFYLYGFDWAPGRYIRWYLNDILIYELNAAALQGGTNAANQSVGDRLIPLEPQYININLAMSDSFAAISADLPLPADMLIDYVRVYQPRGQINVGCDTPDFPSQAYINAHLNDYKINLAGFEDFVGNSSVMGPTMEPPPPDYTVVIAAVTCSLGGTLLLGGGLGFWLWRRRKRRRAQELLEASDPEAAKAAAEARRREEEARRREAEAMPGRERWWLRALVVLWRGSPGANTRHALAPAPRKGQGQGMGAQEAPSMMQESPAPWKVQVAAAPPPRSTPPLTTPPSASPQRLTEPPASPQQFTPPPASPQRLTPPASPQRLTPSASPQRLTEPPASPQQFTPPPASPQRLTPPASPQRLTPPASPQRFTPPPASPQRFTPPASPQRFTPPPASPQRLPPPPPSPQRLTPPRSPPLAPNKVYPGDGIRLAARRESGGGY